MRHFRSPPTFLLGTYVQIGTYVSNTSTFPLGTYVPNEQILALFQKAHMFQKTHVVQFQ